MSQYKRIYIANDHAGVEYKKIICQYFKDRYEVINLGTDETDSVNYAEYAQKLALHVRNDEESFGIVICGSGIGISIAANKVKGIRCAVCYNDHVASLAKQHNNANVLSFGAREMSIEEVINRIEIYLNSEFEGGRHQRRIESME